MSERSKWRKMFRILLFVSRDLVSENQQMSGKRWTDLKHLRPLLSLP